jgi:hypothetical protein
MAGSTGSGRRSMPLRLSALDTGFDTEFEKFIARRRDSVDDVAAVVAAIIADVRTRGDATVAGMAFIRTELGYAAVPPGTYIPAADTGVQRAPRRTPSVSV